MPTKLSEDLSKVLSRSQLPFAEQVACVAAVETVAIYWDSFCDSAPQIILSIETRYGKEVADIFREQSKLYAPASGRDE